MPETRSSSRQSLYDAQLSSAEKRALAKYTHDLRDEIDVLRLAIRRTLDEIGTEAAPDAEQAATLTRCSEVIARLELAVSRLDPKVDEKVRLAALTALAMIEEEGRQ